MTSPVRTYEKISGLKTIITSVAATSANSPEEALQTLDRLNRARFESIVTEEGDLWIRYWQIGAENFVSAEHAAIIHFKRPFPEQTDNLEWVSKNLQDIHRQYGGQWIAVYNNSIVAASPTLPDLLNRITELDRPFITFIPAETVVWTFIYAHQKF